MYVLANGMPLSAYDTVKHHIYRNFDNTCLQGRHISDDFGFYFIHFACFKVALAGKILLRKSFPKGK